MDYIRLYVTGLVLAISSSGLAAPNNSNSPSCKSFLTSSATSYAIALEVEDAELQNLSATQGNRSLNISGGRFAEVSDGNNQLFFTGYTELMPDIAAMASFLTYEDTQIPKFVTDQVPTPIQNVIGEPWTDFIPVTGVELQLDTEDTPKISRVWLKSNDKSYRLSDEYFGFASLAHAHGIQLKLRQFGRYSNFLIFGARRSDAKRYQANLPTVTKAKDAKILSIESDDDDFLLTISHFDTRGIEVVSRVQLDAFSAGEFESFLTYYLAMIYEIPIQIETEIENIGKTKRVRVEELILGENFNPVKLDQVRSSLNVNNGDQVRFLGVDISQKIFSIEVNGVSQHIWTESWTQNLLLLLLGKSR